MLIWVGIGLYLTQLLVASNSPKQLSPSQCLEVSLGTTPQTGLTSPVFSSRIHCCYGGDLLKWLQNLGKGLFMIHF